MTLWLCYCLSQIWRGWQNSAGMSETHVSEADTRQKLRHCSENQRKKSLWWIESSKEQILFENEVFCNIINVFTVTFDQFNASLLNKHINFQRTRKFYWPQTFEQYCILRNRLFLPQNNNIKKDIASLHLTNLTFPLWILSVQLFFPPQNTKKISKVILIFFSLTAVVYISQLQVKSL